MQQQKAIQIGNSIGMTFPKTFLSKTAISAGNPIMVGQSADGTVLTISKSGAGASSITPRFLHILEKVNQQYGQALKTLAKK